MKNKPNLLNKEKSMLNELFGNKKPLIGVIQLLPLPGSPMWDGNIDRVITQAEKEATALASAGLDGILVENFNDVPYTKNHVDPAVVSLVSLLINKIKRMVELPIGINILKNDAVSACAIAYCTKAQFIRVNTLTGISMTDAGFIEGISHKLLRYREQIKAHNIKIFADLTIHSSDILSPSYDLVQIADELVYKGLAEGIILSGIKEVEQQILTPMTKLREAFPYFPLLIESDIDVGNMRDYLSVADGVILTTSLRKVLGHNIVIDSAKIESVVNDIVNLRHQENLIVPAR